MKITYKNYSFTIIKLIYKILTFNFHLYEYFFIYEIKRI